MSGTKRESAGSSGKPSGKGSGQPGKNGKPKKKSAQEIVPIYARLPKGPHRIGAMGVARNQRIRIHGGMIEAVTTRGYQKTSVRLVIGLAGVSRRAFYEQFSGKEDCFLETFDLIVNRTVQRLTYAYRTAGGSPERRMRVMLEALGGELEQNPKALRLVMTDAQTTGPAGLRRLHRIAVVCEGLLSHAFSDRQPPAGGDAAGVGAASDAAGSGATGAGATSDAAGSGATGAGATSDAAGSGATGVDAARGVDRRGELPLPVVRAILGGLRRTTRVRLRDGETDDLDALVKEMLKWMVVFKSPAVEALRPRPCANPPSPETLELEPDACGGESHRARLLRSAIGVALRERKYEDLSKLRIADDARLPIEAFMDLFPGPEACYLEALDVLGDELLHLIANPGLVSADWPAAVCRTVEELLAYLAGSPARLVTLAAKALEAGPAPIANVEALAYEVATLLTEGAPRRPRTRIAVEGVAGALLYVLHCEAIAGRGHRLPVLAEYFSYVILTPFLGPDAAVEEIVRSRTAGAHVEEALPGAPVGAAASNAGTRNGAASNGAAGNGVAARNGSAPAGAEGGEHYRRLADRRSAKYVNTTPTSAESTITTIKGA
jgi:AcrR family transcriptional regulator